MIDAGGLHPTQSTEIRLAGGVATTTTTDDPYAEAEAVEGARRVIELHQEHWPSWEGSVEVRRISGPQDGPPPHD